jgi:hypothetical protein
MQTLDMTFGDMGYIDKPIYHWLGQILYILFTFLITVVLMNLLNGLAVDDIHNIMMEVSVHSFIIKISVHIIMLKVARARLTF